MQHKTGKKIPKLVLKSFVLILLGVLGLIVALLIVLQFPASQKYVTDRVTTYVSKKINSKVSLGGISITFPKDISLTDIYIEDLHKDTLLYAHSIKINLNLWDLLSRKLELKDISISNLTAHIYREFPDTSFNYSFISQAFSSKNNSEPKHDTAKDQAFQFSIKNIELQHIYLTYQDTLNGTNADLKFESFKTNFNVFDLNKKNIHLTTLQLKDAAMLISQDMPLQKDAITSKPVEYALGLNKLDLNNTKIIYHNTPNYQDIRTDIGKLHVLVDHIDIAKQNIRLNKISLEQSAIAYTLNKNITIDTVAGMVGKDTSPPSNWNISLKQLELQNNAFAFNNQNIDPTKNGMDFNHLLLQKINLYGKNISLEPEKISLQLNACSFQEESGFALKQFTTNLTYTKTQIELDKLNIETNNSQIGDHIEIHFPSLSALKDSIGNIETNINLSHTTISLKDIAVFKPDIFNTPNLKLNENMLINLTCKIKGRVDDLFVDQLNIQTLGNTRLELKGNIKEILHPKLIHADILLDNFETTKADIENVLGANVVPKNIFIPSSIKTNGTFKESVSGFDTGINLQTSIGNASVKVKMDAPPHSTDTSYNAELVIENFNLGKLLNDTAFLGPLTMHATIQGKGFSVNSLHADVSTVVDEVVFKKYSYKNLKLEGLVDKKSFNGKMNIADTNLSFNYTGFIDLDSAHTAYRFNFDLVGADLKALHLTDENIRIRTFLQTNLEKENTENITGTGVLKNTLIIKDETKYPFDSLLLISKYIDKVADISLTSTMLNANLKGDITLKQLPSSLKKHFENYFDLQQKDSLQPLKRQHFNFELNVTDPTIFTGGLIPDLEKLTPFAMNGKYDSESAALDFNLNLPQLIYANTIIDTLTIFAHSNSQALIGKLKATEISNPTVKLENIGIGAALEHNELHFNIQTAKDDSTKILLVSGNLKSKDKTFHLKLDPKLILNTKNWSVDNNNNLIFSTEGLIATDFILKDSTQLLSINSTEKNPSSPLKIVFNSFQLETISKLIENKAGLVLGTVNGSIELKQGPPATTFSSDLKLEGLTFKSIPTGNIHLLANNTSNPKKFELQFNLTGNENDINASGFYSTETQIPNLNLSVSISQLNLKTLEPYTLGQISQMSGSIKGNATISGSTDAPDIAGSLRLNSCTFRPKFLNSYLRIEDETIALESRKIRFNSFTLIDSINNKATLDGNIDIKDPKMIPFDLKLKTNDFLALNTTEKDNDLYFGKLYLDSDISLKGNVDHPIINGKIGLKKGTVITYIKPENMVSQTDHKGIVEFIDTLETRTNIMTRKIAKEEITTTKGINLKTNISFDKAVELKMLVDRAAGDSLYIKGSGQLDFTMDELGQTNLIGKYSINEGGYHLTINDLIKKNFSIATGSSVTWSGDVTDPYADISAIYKIKTSPVDLVEDQLTGADQSERNKYRTLMTFLVYLKMNGFVSSPNISFDIQQPANERGALNGAINAKLTELRGDESQLNKQVFALLALNRFIGEDPMENGGSIGLASTSRASASRLLTQELNNLSSKYVKGVDLNLGVNSFEDYSSGQQEGRTQLEIGLSKTLLNDKITVQVGGNIDIEGEKAKQNNASDVAGNISLEYKLTDDGRYKLKGYRKNEYENPIDGDLIKTGFGVIYRRNYNKLKELFSKPKPKKKITE